MIDINVSNEMKKKREVQAIKDRGSVTVTTLTLYRWTGLKLSSYFPSFVAPNEILHYLVASSKHRA